MQRKSLSLAAMTEPAIENQPTVEELAGSYGRNAFHAAYRILGNQSAAQDVQQDVFLRLLERPPKSVESWPALVVTMATRMAIDVYRKHQRRRNLRSLLMARPAPRTPDELADSADLAPQLRRALARLKPRESTAFCLRYFSDMEIPQIAKALDTSENNASVILHRSRKKLAKGLDLNGQEEQS
ncbi:MAG: hypothetical protein DHS20C11_36590 [Lysobacteraceae bacterium]|nr:MAG: hypothetical protein DHS20C11_36590 [Xanthomonadaceae bacterium]